MRTAKFFRLSVALLLSVGMLDAQAQTAQVRVAFSEHLGPMKIDHMALGQGGLSEQPMWADRVAEIRALHPRLIRLFIQEYFDLMPAPGHYSFETLDASVDAILKTGARPLMCICFKPRVLFPTINQDVVEPTQYGAWENLILRLVKHYRDRGAGIQYWEVANEPDIGEDGGCPYRFKPDSYARYYRHTAAAILRADPEALVGGPALASSSSPILPALLDSCRDNHTPLHFVSWHIYSSEPGAIRRTIEHVKDLLKRYPELKPETILDEWNMDLMNPPLDPRFQPCFIAEVLWHMKDADLDYSCYYHIRDWYVSLERFVPFMSRQGAAFMARWWNRMPQFDGLFDYQNNVRPSYFAFKLISRLTGERVPVNSSLPAVHGFAAHDEQMRMYNLVVWNFSASSVQVDLALTALPKELRMRHILLNAAAANKDENAMLVPDSYRVLETGDQLLRIAMEPWALHYWSFEDAD